MNPLDQVKNFVSKDFPNVDEETKRSRNLRV